MNKNEKNELATELKDKFSRAKVAVFANYKGLESNDANELRKLLRPVKAEAKVLKNNIARLVTKDGAMGPEAKQLLDGMVGPTIVAFAYGDPAAVAKIMHKFAEDHEAFELKDSLLGDKKIPAAGIEQLAKLPGREVLLAQVLGTLNAPIQSFVGVLAAVPRSLVTVLSAIERKKSEGGGASA